MRLTSGIVAVAVALLFLIQPTPAVDTTGIEAVRSKSVLDAKDLAVIDSFVAAAVTELIQTQDFSSVSNARAVIQAYSTSKEATQVQYAQQFSESASKHISAALRDVEQLPNEQQKFRVRLNLLMLIDALEDVRLVEIALPYVGDKNKAISYWAVHSVTNPAIVAKLTSGQGGGDLLRKIAGELKKTAAGSSPETMALMVEFAAKSKLLDAEEMLLTIADARIKSYSDWTAEYELLEAPLFGALAEQMKSSNPTKVEAGRRFGQLLSCVMQRYIKGADKLSATQKEHLASVLLETEKTHLLTLTKKSQTAIKRAVEAGDMAALLQEHNRLLGEGAKAGQLPTELGFDYGAAPDGSKLVAPQALPPPPAK